MSNFAIDRRIGIQASLNIRYNSCEEQRRDAFSNYVYQISGNLLKLNVPRIESRVCKWAAVGNRNEVPFVGVGEHVIPKQSVSNLSTLNFMTCRLVYFVTILWYMIAKRLKIFRYLQYNL